MSLVAAQQTTEQLNSALELHVRLVAESSTVLDTLDKKLQGLNKRLAPIHNRATTLTWAEQNINLAKAATDELLQYLDTSRKASPGPRRQALWHAHWIVRCSSSVHPVSLTPRARLCGICTPAVRLSCSCAKAHSVSCWSLSWLPCPT